MATEIKDDLKKINDMSNRRQYYRIEPGRFLCAKINIFSINGEVTNGQQTKVCIENISAGGLAFLSDLEFPVGMDYTLMVEFSLLGKTFKIESVLVRKNDYGNYNLKEYGVVFITRDSVQSELVGTINRMEILQVKSKVPYSECSLCDQRIEKGCFR